MNYVLDWVPVQLNNRKAHAYYVVNVDAVSKGTVAIDASI